MAAAAVTQVAVLLAAAVEEVLESLLALEVEVEAGNAIVVHFAFLVVLLDFLELDLLAISQLEYQMPLEVLVEVLLLLYYQVAAAVELQDPMVEQEDHWDQVELILQIFLVVVVQIAIILELVVRLGKLFLVELEILLPILAVD